MVGLLAVLIRFDLSKDVELLVLRHENQMLRRQPSGPRAPGRRRPATRTRRALRCACNRLRDGAWLRDGPHLDDGGSLPVDQVGDRPHPGWALLAAYEQTGQLDER